MITDKEQGYRFRDFLKPSLPEAVLMIGEFIYITLPVIVFTTLAGLNPLEAILIGVSPQPATYCAGRGYEIFGEETKTKEDFRKTKLPDCLISVLKGERL
jgi:hypothetical protein